MFPTGKFHGGRTNILEPASLFSSFWFANPKWSLPGEFSVRKGLLCETHPSQPRHQATDNCYQLTGSALRALV